MFDLLRSEGGCKSETHPATGLGRREYTACSPVATMYTLRNRVVCITGGSRGLGLVLARTFARRGARLVITARDPAELERADRDLTRRGADVLAFPCDITDKSQISQLVRAAVDWFGRIDVLVNNAGIIEVGPREAMTSDDFARAMAAHFWGPLWTTLAVIPEMQRRGGGRIVNISSIGGLVPVPHLMPYCASKFALTGLSEAMRVELAKDRILVTTVFPGLMRTGSAGQAVFKGRCDLEHGLFRTVSALPFFTMSAPRAARRIARACVRGEPRVVLGLPAKLLAFVHALAPGLFLRAEALLHRLLPAAAGRTEARKGSEGRPRFPPRILTILHDRAATRNNELAPSTLRLS